MANNDKDKNTIICRCEDLSLADIRDAIAEGCCTIDDVKRVTRAGMGPCQGRTCQSMISQEISWHTKVPMDEVVIPTFRPLIKPVKLESFVREGEV